MPPPKDCFDWSPAIARNFALDEDCPSLDPKGVKIPCTDKWREIKLGLCIPKPTPDDLASTESSRNNPDWPHLFGLSNIGAHWMFEKDAAGGEAYGPYPGKNYDEAMGDPAEAPGRIKTLATVHLPSGASRGPYDSEQQYLTWPQARAYTILQAMFKDEATMTEIEAMKKRITCAQENCKKSFKRVEDEDPLSWRNRDLFVDDTQISEKWPKDVVRAPTVAGVYIGVCLKVKVKCTPPTKGPTTPSPGGEPDSQGPATPPAPVKPILRWWELSDEELAAALKKAEMEWASKEALEMMFPRPPGKGSQTPSQEEREPEDDRSEKRQFIEQCFGCTAFRDAGGLFEAVIEDVVEDAKPPYWLEVSSEESLNLDGLRRCVTGALGCETFSTAARLAWLREWPHVDALFAPSM